MNLDDILRWFPLVPRFRPSATNLEERVHQLTNVLATIPDNPSDALAAAAQVYNGAALVASDIGDAGQAKQWCHDHFRAYLPHLPLSAEMAQRMLEPIVNLARLDIRAGNGETAFDRLDQLYNAVRHKTPAHIEDIDIPADHLVTDQQAHRTLRQWLWAILLADGLRALTAAGQWGQAASYAQHHHLIGDRLFDGRQTLIIADLLAGDADSARNLTETSIVEQPWESCVRTTLELLCRRDGRTHIQSSSLDINTAARDLPRDHGMAVFRTRWRLTTFHLANSNGYHNNGSLISDAVNDALVSQDGYLARDILSANHNGDHNQQHQLKRIVHDSGIGTNLLPTHLKNQLIVTLKRANHTFSNNLAPRLVR